MSRKLERVEINQTIPVTNVITQSHFGNLININAEGLMIMTEEEIQTHAIFQLALTLPTPIQGITTLEFGTDCLWCKEAEGSSRFWAGFHIIDIAEQTQEHLDIFIEHYHK